MWLRYVPGSNIQGIFIFEIIVFFSFSYLGLRCNFDTDLEMIIFISVKTYVVILLRITSLMHF